MPIKSHTQKIQTEIVKTLSVSKYSIKAAVAWLTDKKILKVLLAQYKAGVKVEIIINDDEINSNHIIVFKKLMEQGLKIYFHPEKLGLMHHKFCIIDNKILIMGSYNWTYSAAHRNRESIVIIEDEPESIQNFIEEFDLLKKKIGIIEVNNTPIIYSETSNLKAEILFLEFEISALETELIEQTQKISEFDILLKKEIGHLIFHKFQLEIELAKLYADLTQKNDDFEIVEEKEQKINDYEQHWQQAKAKETIHLSEIDTEAMKKMYRESMMMAHPDRFVNEPEKQDEANNISATLSEAYKDKNFEKVKEIYQQLKDGIAFKTDWSKVTNIEFFKKIIEKLLTKKAILLKSIKENKGNITFEIKEKYIDIEAYFNELKVKIENEIQKLNKEIRQYQ
jgi:hypothetical protein